MKKYLLALACLLFVSVGHAQTVNLGTVTGTGPTLNQVNYRYYNGAVPANYTLAWTNAGTAPAVCTFQVEGSLDQVNWFAIVPTGTSGSPVTSCATTGIESFRYQPMVFLRVNVLSYTQGDITTAVAFSYTRGQ